MTKALLIFFAVLLHCQATHVPPPIMVNGHSAYCWVEPSGDIYGMT